MNPIDRIEQLRFDLARVTAERDAERALTHELGVALRLAKRGDPSASEAASFKAESAVLRYANTSLRARVAELEEQAERYRLVTLRQDATIAELVAALRFIREECDWEPYRDRGGDVRIGEVCDKALGVSTQRLPQEPCGGRCGDADCDLDTNGQALARAESAEHKSKTDPSLSEIRMSESSTPAKHCDECAPEFGCFDGGEPCYKKPLVKSTPAKHPDTEPEVIGGYEGTDGRRYWWTGGAWIYPGQEVAVIAARNQEAAR